MLSMRRGYAETEFTMLYAITNRQMYGADEASRRQGLLDHTALWAANGVEFIQLREKDLSACDQVALARAMLAVIQSAHRQHGSSRAPRLLINGRPDVALAAGADGVHLPSGAETLTPGEVRDIYARAFRSVPHSATPFVSISCHTLPEVEEARRQEANCILFAPVFEKMIAKDDPQFQPLGVLPGTGLSLLQEACRIAAPVPVLALGGVTAANASNCLKAGAAGIAAIRLMTEDADIWRPFA